MSTAATMRPFAISGLDHLLVLVDDMPSALDFYQGVLGCSVEARLPQYAMVELRAGTDHVDLVDVGAREGHWARPAQAGGINVDHFALAIQSQDETAVRDFLAANGVEIVEERADQTTSGRSFSFYVLDPTGNKVELILRESAS